MLGIRSLLAAMPLLACLGSFAWGMRHFFVRPQRMTAGMKTVTIAGAVSGLLHLAALVSQPGIVWSQGAGSLSLYGLSLWLFWWAVAVNSQRPLAACFSDSGHSHLTQHGPYRLMRHPFYCSYLLSWLGGLVATGSPWLILTLVLMLAIYITAARREEAGFAASPLAVEYAKYKRRTGMFFPRYLRDSTGEPAFCSRLRTSMRNL